MKMKRKCYDWAVQCKWTSQSGCPYDSRLTAGVVLAGQPHSEAVR